MKKEIEIKETSVADMVMKHIEDIEYKEYLRIIGELDKEDNQEKQKDSEVDIELSEGFRIEPDTLLKELEECVDTDTIAEEKPKKTIEINYDVDDLWDSADDYRFFIKNCLGGYDSEEQFWECNWN